MPSIVIITALRHYCLLQSLESVVPSSNQYCIDIVVPSSDHCYTPPFGDDYFTKKVAPLSDHFFFRLFPSGVATAEQIFHLQLVLTSVSSSVISTSAMPSFTTSINLLFGHTRFLFPGNSIISIIHPIGPIPIIFPPYMSIPPQSCLSCFLSKPSHLCSPLMYSFLILSIIVTPNENRVTSSNLPPPSPPPYFRQCHRIQPIQHCRSHCHLVHLPFHYSWYSPVADHS